MPRLKVVIITSNQIISRFGKMAHTLGKNGYDVEVLNWDKTANREEYERHEFFIIKNYHMISSKDHHNLTMPIYYGFWWLYVFRYLINKKPDIIQPENFYHYIPVLLANIFIRKKIVYDIADFFASSFAFSLPIKRAIAKLENYCIKFAEIVIIADEYRKREINLKNVKKLLVILNTPDNVYPKLEMNGEGCNQNFIIYYGGWINKTRGMDQLIEVLKEMSNVTLIIAGEGPDLSKYLPMFNSVQNFNYIGVIDSFTSLYWTKKANLIFAFYDPKIPINRLASPNKLFDAMMCGTAVIGNTEAEPVADRIKRYNCGYLVNYHDIEQLKDILNDCLKNRILVKIKGENGRKAYLEKYNWNVMENRLLEGYNSII